MKMSKLFPRTLYGEVAGSTAAQALLVKAGFIKQVASGVYILLPLGFRVWRQIQNIIWEEMENEGVQNLQLPILHPQELWEATGRWDQYVASQTIFETTERHSGAKFGLAPTAEEVVTHLAKEAQISHRDLPIIWHQIGWKFRDELRPRFGLLRCREFDMSDAYSFDKDEAGMRQSFELLRQIYDRIFRRVGLTNCLNVLADSGAIGGQGSSEFMALSDEGGEDTLITCGKCHYGANAEKAGSVILQATPAEDPSKPVHLEHTPNARTVEDLCKLFPELDATRMVKTIIFTVDGELGPDKSYQVAVCIRGDLEVNPKKLTNALGAQSVNPAEASVVRAVTEAEVGFAGPIGLKNTRVIFDNSVQGLTNVLCGGNQTDHHYLDATPGRDFPAPEKYYDLHLAKAGHHCPECQSGVLVESRGIEVGHIFMLQTKYSGKLGATFCDEAGKQQLLWMGCYGIGTTRLMQAVVEQNRDPKGIVWPESVAPFKVVIVPVKYSTDQVQRQLADSLYQALRLKGVATLIDDRSIQVGVKFFDADLIGCPWRVTVGRGAAKGTVELLNRRTGEVLELSAEEVVSRLNS